ncbi:DUF6580 family putative transport protein [Niabella yanshanensis]|uniref:DUF6580 family putative transport protein n=1 Tax=Niabella yanshanensis TaxID=577386 RepID=A0ABZ0WBM4_9BACT|nr:DUF6580 family putative transport protein [Niabella yanshanensis]WQD40611.1 DUF6580 family putative transport protein [Niabella yanshanensis]
MNKLNVKVGVLVAIILVAALSKLIFSHFEVYNLSPLVAIALFGGSQFKNKGWAYCFPVLAFLISDLAFYLIGKTGFYGVSQFFVYGSILLITAMGTTLHNLKPIKILGYSLTGSALFWIISNFGVWVGSRIPGAIEYEPGLTLGMTYLRALPFYNEISTQMFRNAFGGDIFYTFLLFGIYALIQKTTPAVRYSNS